MARALHANLGVDGILVLTAYHGSDAVRCGRIVSAGLRGWRAIARLDQAELRGGRLDAELHPEAEIVGRQRAPCIDGGAWRTLERPTMIDGKGKVAHLGVVSNDRPGDYFDNMASLNLHVVRSKG